MESSEENEKIDQEKREQKKIFDMEKISLGIFKNLKLSQEKKEKVIILFLLGVFFY